MALTEQARREIAAKVAKAAEPVVIANGSKPDLQAMPVAALEAYLNEILVEWRRGVEVLNYKKGKEQPVITCFVCRSIIPPGKWSFKDDGFRQAPGELPRTVFVGGPSCDPANHCYERFQQNRPRFYPAR
jgi:hypothetical protein